MAGLLLTTAAHAGDTLIWNGDGVAGTNITLNPKDSEPAILPEFKHWTNNKVIVNAVGPRRVMGAYYDNISQGSKPGIPINLSGNRVEINNVYILSNTKAIRFVYGAYARNWWTGLTFDLNDNVVIVKNSTLVGGVVGGFVLADTEDGNINGNRVTIDGGMPYAHVSGGGISRRRCSEYHE